MKTKFISQSENAEKFHHMIMRLGEITDVDTKFIRKSCERAITEWEEKNQKDLTALFHVSDRVKHEELHKIVRSFQRTLGEKVDSHLIMKKIDVITEFWLNDLYYSF